MSAAELLIDFVTNFVAEGGMKILGDTCRATDEEVESIDLTIAPATEYPDPGRKSS